MRHFTNLSHLNYSIDGGFYPLGSCTMKYNPKINEDAARLPGFAALHPLTDEDGSQGALALMYTLEGWLAEIAGFAGASLDPGGGRAGRAGGHPHDPQVSSGSRRHASAPRSSSPTARTAPIRRP